MYAWGSWEKVERYTSENPEVAEEVRQHIIKRIGFEPNLQVSYITEMKLREDLLALKSGTITEEKFQGRLRVLSDVVIRRVSKEIPEQAHLIAEADRRRLGLGN